MCKLNKQIVKIQTTVLIWWYDMIETKQFFPDEIGNIVIDNKKLLMDISGVADYGYAVRF